MWEKKGVFYTPPETVGINNLIMCSVKILNIYVFDIFRAAFYWNFSGRLSASILFFSAFEIFGGAADATVTFICSFQWYRALWGNEKPELLRKCQPSY